MDWPQIGPKIVEKQGKKTRKGQMVSISRAHTPPLLTPPVSEKVRGVTLKRGNGSKNFSEVFLSRGRL